MIFVTFASCPLPVRLPVMSWTHARRKLRRGTLETPNKLTLKAGNLSASPTAVKDDDLFNVIGGIQ